MNCKDCPHKQIQHRLGNTTKNVFCKHTDQRYIIEYFDKHRLKKAYGFIGYINSKGDFPVKKAPKWCPLLAEKGVSK